MQVEIFIPCFIDQVYPETGFNFVKVLEKAGAEIHYNEKQTCCGQPSFNSGYWDETRKVARKFIKDFANDKYIVSPSASCTGFIRNYYPKVFENMPEYEASKEIGKRVYEFSDFIVNILKVNDLGAEFNHKVTYHDSCASLREYKLKNEPRTLLSNVRGLELVELQENTTCCGFGGTFAVKHSEISQAMAQQKVEYALETGAEFIVSTDSSCLLNINSYAEKQKLPIRGIHLVDVLASGY